MSDSQPPQFFWDDAVTPSNRSGPRLDLVRPACPPYHPRELSVSPRAGGARRCLEPFRAATMVPGTFAYAASVLVPEQLRQELAAKNS